MQKKSSSSVQIFYPRFNKEQIIQAIRDRLEQLRSELDILLVVLFGSYAKGNYTVASDVDLLVIYGGEERKDAYATIKRVVEIPNLEPHVYTKKEYEEMEGAIKKMIEDGHILFRRSFFRSTLEV